MNNATPPPDATLSDDCVEQRHALDARNALIVNQWLAGTTVTALAQQHGISRQRIRQILNRHPGLKEERDRRTRLRQQHQRRRVVQ